MARIKSFSGLFFIVLFICMCGCKKTEVPDMDTSSQIDTAVVITEKGVPFGDIVTSTIGPDGGTITAADGGATLVVPRGALSANTSVSVQAVTNTLPQGLGDHAYQFLPEGLVFAVPARLTIKYDTSANQGVSSAGLVMVNQESDGSWMHDAEVTTDENKFTISADMEHFSSWIIARAITITPGKSNVELGGDVTLLIQAMEKYIPESIPGKKRAKAKVKNQSISRWLKESAPDYFVSGWRLNYNNSPGLIKDGALKPSTSLVYATYKAPSQLSPVRNPVVIQVVLSNRVNSNLISDAYVYVRKNGYLKATIGNQVFEYVQSIGEPSTTKYVNAAIIPPNQILIQAFDIATGTSVSVIWFGKRGTSTIPYRRDFEGIGVSTSSTKSWAQEYYTRENGNGTTRCNEFGPKYRELSCTLSEFTGDLEGWFAGTITGTLYDDTDVNKRACQNSDARSVKIEFVLKAGR